jgi:putative FmdB family regulatory protein
MPIYEYRCSSCGAQDDVIQKMSDAPLTICPVCGKETYAKQISAAGFQPVVNQPPNRPQRKASEKISAYRAAGVGAAGYYHLGA